MGATERVFACGVTESGKTEFLIRRFLPRVSRLLVVDQTGEWAEREPHAPYAFGYEDTVRQLGALSTRDRWRLIASLEQDEMIELTERLLVPIPNPRTGLPAAIGGMGILLDEVDVLCPAGRAPVPLTHLWRRGRHVGLSVYAATQRPANVSKEATAMCRYIAVLRTSEANDVDYLARRMGREVVEQALRVVNRQRYTAFLWDVERHTGFLIDGNGRVFGTIKPRQFEDSQQRLDL